MARDKNARRDGGSRRGASSGREAGSGRDSATRKDRTDRRRVAPSRSKGVNRGADRRGEAGGPWREGHVRSARNRVDALPPEGQIEGRKPFEEALRARRPIDKIWTLERAAGDADSLLPLIREAEDRGIPVSFVDRSVLDRMADGRNHQGLVARAAAKETLTLEALLEATRAKAGRRLFVLCDRIQDPHNLGAILRTVDGSGADGTIIPERRSAGLDAVVAKASAGAVEHVPCARVVNLAQCIARLKDEGFWIVGTDMDGEDLYSGATLNALAGGDLVLVVGNEGSGIARKIREACDLIVSIPMEGRIESLNASVATALCAYEILRRRRMLGSERNESTSR